MATIPQILGEIWPGMRWTVTEDDYGTLSWDASNAVAKPSESEIRAYSTEVDAALVIKNRQARQQRELYDSNDYLLKAFEIIIDGMAETYRVVQDMRNTMVAGAHTGSFTAWDATTINKMTALRNRIQELRNIT